jgi:hypothetical protein
MATSGSSRRVVPMICQAGLVVGMLVLLAGALWQNFARPQHVWTEDKAEQYRAAQSQLHTLIYDDPAAPSAPESPERAAARDTAKERFNRIQQELDDAIETHRHRGARLMQAGLAAIVLFGVGYLSSRRE